MSKRRSVEVPGLEHTHPIPNASRVGQLLMTGGIYGKDPATGKLAPDAAGQCKLMFDNIRRVLEASGATPAHSTSETGVRRDKAALSSGCKSQEQPARLQI